MPAGDTILIIDDDSFSYQMISRILHKAGWNCVHAVHPDQARKLLSEQEFICILLDYCMPHSDGLLYLQELTSIPNPAPVIMITAEGNEMVAVKALKNGALDYLPKALLNPDSLIRVIQHALEKQRLIIELSQTQEQMARLALYDTLTDLGNRGLFFRDLSRAIAIAEREHSHFHVLMMDMDKFKSANDMYGHEAGDRILQVTAQRLRTAGRAADLFYRLGGDEFTALLNVADPVDILHIANRLTALIAQPYHWHDATIYLGMSIGIARYPEQGETPESLLRAADRAMYHAKRNGMEIAFASPETLADETRI
ncbi:MAG TPA: diguanylate cyclase [Burkholderiales bacterium]|nr:diguanylate cyclase [Burkholderiales bacterium]